MAALARFRRRSVPFALMCCVLAAQGGAQDRAATMRPCPHGTGDEAVMRRAGYESLGPFEFGHNRTSADVEALLPDEPLRWIETPHFRIGCALPTVAVSGSKEWQASLRNELQTLAKRLPNVDSQTRNLDPWLRAHLVAQRAEQMYATVSAMLGRTHVDFPRRAGHDAHAEAEFFGIGPYFGMPQKFTILLLHKGASLTKYTAAHHGWATSAPTRHQDSRHGSVIYAAAGDNNVMIGADEEANAALLAFHVAHNLYTSYRAFGHMLPAWLPQGLALWHGRCVSTRVELVPVSDDAGRDAYRQWERRLPLLRKDWAFEPLPTLFERMDAASFRADEHLQCWALVDWLQRDQPKQLAAFVHRMKDPFHERLRFPTHDELFARQRLALNEAFGTDARGLEQQWKERGGDKRRAKR